METGKSLLPAELVIIVGVCESIGILKNFPHPSHELIQKLSPLRIVEQGPGRSEEEEI